MPGGSFRSALVLSWSEGLDRRASDLEPSAPRTLELARLLGDRSIGGFEVSMMTSADEPALRLELIRFLADRAPEDTVVVHLAGHLALDEAPDVFLGGARPGGARRTNQALPLTFLRAELSRCRSERMVIVLDCPPDGPVSSSSPAPVGHDLALEERLGGPGRSVHVASTATVIDALGGTPASGQIAGAEALRRALLAPDPERRPARPPTLPLLGALTALAALVVVASTLVVTALGAAGVALSGVALMVVGWPLVGLGMQEWRQLPHQEVVLGEGVPFYELYMLRRSKKSKDHFRHHGTR